MFVPMGTKEKPVDRSLAGMRLDQVLPMLWPEVSRTLGRKLIGSGAVYVNSSRCHKNGKILRMGDRVSLVQSEEARRAALAPRTEFEITAKHILFEDDHWLVLNKPPGLPTHATVDTSRHHLVRAAEAYLEKSQPKGPYVGVHHRLDKDTSGVILFSKSKEANGPLAKAFQERAMEKTYLAICKGPSVGERTIKSYMGPSPRNKRIQSSLPKGGKFAETKIRTLEERKGLFLVEAKPTTGRMHQIRVHLSECGMPILGDTVYGGAPGPRVLLHAWRLELLGKSFCAPLPDDFQQLAFRGPEE
jgi:23S rRNA pseudouridine1911/1915/1917 synthase